MELARQRFDRAPMMVYWEMTRACDLACRHCRAEAVPQRHPLELATEEGRRLLRQLRDFGEPAPHLVLTGGDPLQRPDVYDLAAYGVQLGLQVSITPSATPRLTRDAVRRLRDAGVRTLALSLDGSDAARHDRIRGVRGSYAHTLEAAWWVREADLSLQINSLVCAETARDLADVYERVLDLDADRWSVFFLVSVGRGRVLSQLTPEETEAVLHWIYELSQESPRPIIKTTEAHHYRRIAVEAERAAHGRGARSSGGRAAAPEGARAAADSALRRGFGIRDGAGIMFVSHTGEVYPSGFLPVSAGNVRLQDPVQLYREAPLFRTLRDPGALKGKCGACEYRAICGGARSRAWAATGDPLAADPLCVYQPATWAAQVAAATESMSAVLPSDA